MKLFLTSIILIIYSSIYGQSDITISVGPQFSLLQINSEDGGLPGVGLNANIEGKLQVANWLLVNSSSSLIPIGSLGGLGSLAFQSKIGLEFRVGTEAKAIAICPSYGYSYMRSALSTDTRTTSINGLGLYKFGMKFFGEQKKDLQTEVFLAYHHGNSRSYWLFGYSLDIWSIKYRKERREGGKDEYYED
jgi:hypothetical protein